MDLYNCFKKFAFSLDPEFVHHHSLDALGRFPLLADLFSHSDLENRYQLKVGELNWQFPLGLAAGLDKNAQAIDFFTRLGFGAVEVGTITPRPQIGNSKPRLFRLIEEESLRNKMGFNNAGSKLIADSIRSSKRNGKLLGANLGKNKDTPAEKALDDYRILYETFAPISDYLVINVSSPNTPGLRDLQRKGELVEIFKELAFVRKACPKPLYVKISPDLAEQDAFDVVDLAKEFELEGIIATNTSIMSEFGDGGVSGKLIKERSKKMRQIILDRIRESQNQTQLIGVGGIDCFDDLWSFWLAGGKVVQIYTSFIYGGPPLLSSFRRDIDRALEVNGCSTLNELLGNIESAVCPT